MLLEMLGLNDPSYKYKKQLRSTLQSIVESIKEMTRKKESAETALARQKKDVDYYSKEISKLEKQEKNIKDLLD